MAKRLIWIVLSLALVAGGLLGCGRESEPEGYGPLVVEGWIDSDGHPVVILSRSLLTGGTRGEDASGQHTRSGLVAGQGGDLDDLIVRWGVVKIDDGEKEVYLSGGPYEGYIPPYRYTTTEMFGEPGRTYTITAGYAGDTVRARCTMPPKPIVGELIFESTNEGRDLMSATIEVTAPEDAPAYYHLSTRLVGKKNRLLPALFGSFCIENPGEQVRVPVFRGKEISDTKKYLPQWPVDSLMEVRVERVTEEVYRFWQSYDNAVAFGTVPFIGSIQSLPTTIDGGYGYFSAQGTLCLRHKVMINDK